MNPTIVLPLSKNAFSWSIFWTPLLIPCTNSKEQCMGYPYRFIFFIMYYVIDKLLLVSLWGREEVFRKQIVSLPAQGPMSNHLSNYTNVISVFRFNTSSCTLMCHQACYFSSNLYLVAWSLSILSFPCECEKGFENSYQRAMIHHWTNVPIWPRGLNPTSSDLVSSCEEADGRRAQTVSWWTWSHTSTPQRFFNVHPLLFLFSTSAATCHRSQKKSQGD